MSFIALIPARKNSKRIKNKNILKYRNKTLVEISILQAKKSKYIKEIYISTDSNKIKNIALRHKIKVPFIRPKKLSNSKAKMEEVINHFLKKTHVHKKFKYLVLLQPTSPLRKSIDIDNSCYRAIKYKSDVIVSGIKKKIKQKNSKMMKILNKKKRTLNLNDKTFSKNKNYIIRNGPAILIINLENFKRKLYFGKVHYYLMPQKRSLDINTIDDLKKLNIKI